MNAPPMIGPRTVPNPQVKPVPPIYMGRSCIEVVPASKVITPTYIPDPPTPAIALPTIKASMFGAAPQSADPTSKRKTVKTYSHFASNWP